MKKIILSVIILLAAISAGARNYSVTSPSGHLKMTVSNTDSLSYSLWVKGKIVMENCAISMQLKDGTVLGGEVKFRKDTRGTRTETVLSPFYRQAEFEVRYNYLNLHAGNFTLQIRAYNDGVAYRFVGGIPGEVEVGGETVEYRFAEPFDMYVPYTRGNEDRFESSFEAQYTFQKVGQNRMDAQKLAFMPVLVDVGQEGKILLMESDVEDYPGIFLEPVSYGFKALFAPLPKDYRTNEKGVRHAKSYQDVIARTSGSRSFPWRIIGYGEKDTDLAVNNMVYQLASPSRVSDISWITPGQSTWDWWNANTLYGVDFKSGINTETYKYDIDFAAAHGIPYVIVDEGWYKNLDPMQIADGIDVEHLLAYSVEKGVKLILWATVSPLHDNLEEICRHYSALGAGGFKVDFFDSQDQEMVNNIYDIARVAAENRLILDLHGMYKPTGLSRTYPNVLNYEGVHGMEQLKWSDRTETDMPLNDCLIPYLRQASGPIDYTQGGLRNETRDGFRAIFERPMTQGTRAHQVALYVVFESPLTMLCDSPSDYIREEETTRFINEIPAVVDRTLILGGEIGKYIVTARCKDGKWYVGGITNWDSRKVDFDLSFLGEGEWKARIFSDTVNSDRIARDYSIREISVNAGTSLEMDMANGGGFAIIIEK